MTWVPRKKSMKETKEIFVKAKRMKQTHIKCPLCFNGEKYDSKQGIIRDCSLCAGLGKVKNPNFKYPDA